MERNLLMRTLCAIVELDDINSIKAELMRIEEPFVAADDMDSLELAADIISRINRRLLTNCMSDGSTATRAQFVRTYERTRHLIALYYKDQCAEMELFGINQNSGTELVVRVDPQKPHPPVLTSEDQNGWIEFKLTYPAAL